MITIFELITQEKNWLTNHKSEIIRNSKNINESDYNTFAEENEPEEIIKINPGSEFDN